MPFVIVTKTSPPAGEDRPRTKEIAGRTLRIGHGEQCDLIVPDPSVGAEQAVIQEINGAYILRHVSERGQTFVNDKPVKEALLTKKGSIRIGMVYLHFSRPTLKSPLTIEYRPMTDTAQTLRSDMAKTLVLNVSPVAAQSVPADPDATQKLTPMTAQPQPDPDATLVLSPLAAESTPVDTDATQKLEPVSKKEPEDPDKTLALPRKKKPKK